VIDKLDKIIAAMQWKAGTAAEREAVGHARGYRLAITGVEERLSKK